MASRSDRSRGTTLKRFALDESRQVADQAQRQAWAAENAETGAHADEPILTVEVDTVP